MQSSQTVWAGEPACHRGREHDWIAGVFGVFLDQQFYRFLRQVDRPHRVGGFRLRDLHLAVDPSSRFAHRQRLHFQVKVIPEKGYQLAPAQPCGQFQIEHGEHAVFLSSGEIGTDLFRRERSHFLLFLGRQFASCGGVVWDEPLLYRLVQTLAKHGVKATDGFGAQAQVFHALVALDPAFGFGSVVKPLDIQRGELIQPDFADARNNVLVDVVLVVGGGGFPDGRFGVVLEPCFSPLPHCELAGLVRIHFSSLLQRRRQLFLALFLRFCQNVFVDGLAGLRVVSRCVTALPAAILALADVTLTICSFLSRNPSPP